jgi:hypothetical protein
VRVDARRDLSDCAMQHAYYWSQTDACRFKHASI